MAAPIHIAAKLLPFYLLLLGLQAVPAEPERPAPTIWEFVNRRGLPKSLGPAQFTPRKTEVPHSFPSTARKLLRLPPRSRPAEQGNPATPLPPNPPPPPTPPPPSMTPPPPPLAETPAAAPRPLSFLSDASPPLAPTPSPLLSTEVLPLPSSESGQSADERRGMREARSWSWGLLRFIFPSTPTSPELGPSHKQQGVATILGMSKLATGGGGIRSALLGNPTIQPAQPYPVATSKVAPDPLPFWGPKIKAPFPTNKFFQNFVLDQGAPNSQHTYGGFPEMVHPYLVRSEVLMNLKGISLSYPTCLPSETSIELQFTRDLTATCSEGLPQHKLTSYNDFGATLTWGTQLTAPLVRGSPYITLVLGPECTPMISSDHAILSLTPNEHKTKYVVTLNSFQTYAIYSSAPIGLTQNGNSFMTADAPFQGVLRIALLKSQSFLGTPTDESTLDAFSSCYPTGGSAEIPSPGQMVYKYQTASWDDQNNLLMLSLPYHRAIMEFPPPASQGGLQYRAIEGGMQAVRGNTWLLKDKVPTITWHSTKPVAEEGRAEVIAALQADIAGLVDITSTSTYFAGKAMARVARLALIAEELNVLSAKTAALALLRNTLTSWLSGTFPGNSFVYDPIWGGIVTTSALGAPLNEFGLGMFNDHHFQYGYFVYSGAVLAKMDPEWALTYKPHLYTLVRDYMSPVADSLFPRLRNFDTWLLHSWASGLFPFMNGRNQESSSEAVNAYYGALLLGTAYGDTELVSLAQSLTAFEIRSTQSLWHIPANSDIYDPVYVRGNRMAGNVWATKVDSNLWWAPQSNLANRVGIQLIPITPIAEALFSNPLPFVSSLVRWAVAMPDWDNSEVVPDSWRAFIYALQAFYDKPGALALVRNLQTSDDGNSLTNMLYWVHTRK